MKDRARELDPALVAAYKATWFVVELPSGPVTFQVGGHPEGTLTGLQGRSLAVLTAHNPGMERPGQPAIKRRTNDCGNR